MLRKLQTVYRFPFGIFTYSLLFISFLGVLDSFLDVDGNRYFAYLPLITPAILASGYFFTTTFVQNLTAAELTSRFYFSFFIITIPFIVLEYVMTFVMWGYFSWKDLVEFNHWWDEGLGFVLIISFFIIIGLHWLSLLFVSIIVTIPLLAFRNPTAFLQGSILLKIKDKQIQLKLTRVAMVGLSTFTIGITLRQMVGYFYPLDEQLKNITSIFDYIPVVSILFGSLCIFISIFCFLYFFIQFILHTKKD